MPAVQTDRIEKKVLLRAPRSRVWRALTNAQEFGQWFGVRLTGSFAPGKEIEGPVTHKGYEHIVWKVRIEKMEPERLFSWRWHPAAVEPGQDYTPEPNSTLVVFQLEEVEGGTRARPPRRSGTRLGRRCRAARAGAQKPRTDLGAVGRSARPPAGVCRIMIIVKLTSVLVDDQAKALRFYTDVLGFRKKKDIPMGEFRWLTVVAAADSDGVELLLEPDAHPAAKTFKNAMVADAIPATSFATDDVQREYKRMVSLGVVFRTGPTKMGPATVAVFEDTCGNLIQLAQI